MNYIFRYIKNNIVGNTVIKNSFLGIISNILQNIFFSIFFIIIARNFAANDFGNYVISNTLYSFVLSFSTLGLGNWFVRELNGTLNRELLIEKFIKIQFLLGCIFYLFLLLTVSIIYDSIEIRVLSFIIGLNLIPDNLIYVVKSIGIADIKQERAFIISTAESIVKFLISVLLLITTISLIQLTILLIILRITSLAAFLIYGTGRLISLKNIFNIKPDIRELAIIIQDNWAFVVIASIAVVNWRIGNIFISKYMTLKEVGYYEIAFKLLSIAYIIPVVVSSTIFPSLVKSINENNSIKNYNKIHFAYTLYGFLTFTFIYSFSDKLVPLLFGSQYATVSQYCKQMFSVMLVFPSVLLQANLLIALKKEKADMYCNLISLLINIIICTVALNFTKSISVVIFAITSSFFIFHIIQDVVLINSKTTKILQVINFYVFTILGCLLFYFLSITLNAMVSFTLFWTLVLIAILILYKYQKQNNVSLAKYIPIMIDQK